MPPDSNNLCENDGTDPTSGSSVASLVGTRTVPVAWTATDNVVGIASVRLYRAAALVLSAHPGYSATQMKECIVDAAENAGPIVPDHSFHVINAREAIECPSEG